MKILRYYDFINENVTGATTSEYLFGKAIKDTSCSSGIDSDPHGPWGLPSTWPNTCGWDFFAAAGTPFYSPISGKVTSIANVDNGKTVYGWAVTIVGNNSQIYASHLEKPVVKLNQIVNQGDLLGKVAQWPPERKKTPHIHLAIATTDSKPTVVKLNTLLDNNLKFKNNFTVGISTNKYKV